MHRDSGKIKSVMRQSAGNVTGLSIVEFVSLPSNARVSISYTGEPDSKGFMGLRKI